jgi:trans-aconitate 2-methyltransferase
MRWDPTQYARYAGERGRPFIDLVARIGAVAPRRVVDLGCGPGNLTELLCDRWPDATVEGVDSSPDMIAEATARGGRASYRVGDIAGWTPDADVVIANAALQWVPTHRDLLREWSAALPAGGWLAFQVPGNFGAPSHALMREVAASPRWAPRVGGALRHADVVDTPIGYAALLLDAGLAVDAWETTYAHLLHGDDPVLEWVRGTGLRPILAALAASEADAAASAADAAAFEAEYAARLREAYPATVHGTFLEFRRIFVVAHRPEAGRA